MDDMSPDTMIIRASGFGPAMTARQSIRRAKEIMLDLEAISPWRRPFDVSGCTKESGNMPIAEDFSDFDDVVMRALLSYDDTRYDNEDNPDAWTLTPDSMSPYGFRETFSNAPTAGEYENRVSVSLQAAGVESRVSRDNARYIIRVPFHSRREVNIDWLNPAVVCGLFDYFLTTYNPQRAVVYGRNQAHRVSQRQDNYTIGWLNYTRNPEVMRVFEKSERAVPYRAGLLLKLGNDASALSDPKVDAELVKLGQMLASAGVTR